MGIVGLHESPDTLIQNIGVGKQQLVEICKAISKNVKLLILDEPTAALNDEESDTLLNLIQEFKEQGITSILISHKLREVTKVCDAITIIRDGETIETLYKGDNRSPHHQGHGGQGADQPVSGQGQRHWRRKPGNQELERI